MGTGGISGKAEKGRKADPRKSGGFALENFSPKNNISVSKISLQDLG